LAVYADQLLNDLIIPVLTRKVNEHSAYVELREGYRALLLAQRYKNNSTGSADYFLRNSASTALDDAGNDLRLPAEQIYKEYLRSLKKGEYNFSESRQGQLDFYLSVITRDYFSGGFDLRGQVRIENVRENVSRGASVKVYSVDVYMPKKEYRPLKFVINRLELKAEQPVDVSHLALAEDLPEISYDRFNEPSFIARENFSSAVLSSL
jgi:hypothetical protein